MNFANYMHRVVIQPWLHETDVFQVFHIQDRSNKTLIIPKWKQSSPVLDSPTMLASRIRSSSHSTGGKSSTAFHSKPLGFSSLEAIPWESHYLQCSG